MNKAQTFEQFLVNETSRISLFPFLMNLAGATLLALLLAGLYARFGNSLSNRKLFSRNLVYITMTTMLVISIVKTSLALSLGLVGALSIVRFRAAIKEPEELAFLFLAIAIGLGFGASQGPVTLLAFVVISGVVMVMNRMHRHRQEQNLHLTVVSSGPDRLKMDDVVQILKDTCTEVALRRLDEDGDSIQATFKVAMDHLEQLEQVREKLRGRSQSVQLTYMDTEGVY